MTPGSGPPARTVREFDGADPATVDALLPVVQAAVAHDQVRHPPPDRAIVESLLDPRHATSFPLLLAGFDEAGTAVAFVRGAVNRRKDPTIARARFWTDPSHRRRGFGTLLLDAAKAWSRDRGCDRLVVDGPTVAADPPFVAANGGRFVIGYLRSVLDLRAIDVARFRGWAMPTGPEGPGRENARYRSVRWTDRCPEELVAAFAKAAETMYDKPIGDLEVAKAPIDVEAIRRREETSIASGTRRHTVAVLAPDGSMAGFTRVVRYAASAMPMAVTGDTAVAAGHRGHGLGLRMKAEMALWMLAEEPDVTTLETVNAGENEPMLRVNRALGYEAAEAWHSYLFPL